MTDRLIIFSAPMVRALLDGRKTQTRRVLPLAHPKFSHQNVLDPDMLVDKQYVWFWDGVHDCVGASWTLPYAPGDRLWVREAHYLTDDGESEYAVFAADQGDVDEHLASMQTTMTSHPSIDWSKHLRLRPSIHMPRWASRLTLTVTDVRVQRLQDISEADAVAEGIQRLIGSKGPNYFTREISGKWSGSFNAPTAAEVYSDLWNSLHGPGAWDANPWVVALTFTVQRGNIDKIGGVNG